MNRDRKKAEEVYRALCGTTSPAEDMDTITAALAQARREGVRQLWHDLLANTRDSREADWVELVAAPLLVKEESRGCAGDGADCREMAL